MRISAWPPAGRARARPPSRRARARERVDRALRTLSCRNGKTRARPRRAFREAGPDAGHGYNYSDTSITRRRPDSYNDKDAGVAARYFGLIPAAGSGSRLGGAAPKQYLSLA